MTDIVVTTTRELRLRGSVSNVRAHSWCMTDYRFDPGPSDSEAHALLLLPCVAKGKRGNFLPERVTLKIQIL